MATKLVDIISRASTPEVIQYLRRIPENRWIVELTQCNSQGQTSLRLAIEQGNIELIKVLLSFNAPIKDAENYAQEFVKKHPQDLQRQRVYALVKSRIKWLNSTSNNQEIVFSRSMQVIEEAVDKIQGAAQKTGVLFFGITGEGKSTLINYLSGVDYKVEKVTSLRKRTLPLSTELVQTGNSTTSETLFPQVVSVKNRSYVWIDLPGFEDTRGTIEEICAAASIYMLTKQLRAIQAIPMVCSLSALQEPRMTVYRIAAHNIGAIISRNPQAAENLILVVTKTDKDLSQNDVKERLLLLAKEEGWNSSSSTEHVREDMDDNAWKKYCLKITTETLLSRQESIVIADITTPEARTFFQGVVDSLQNKKKSPEFFDFKNYSRFMVQFQSVLIRFISQYIEMAENHQRLLKMVEETKTAIEGKNCEIDKLENEKKNLKQFDQEPYLKRIEDIQNELQRLKTTLNSLANDKESLEQQIRQYEAQIIFLESSLQNYELKKEPARISARQKVETAFDSAMKITTRYNKMLTLLATNLDNRIPAILPTPPQYIFSLNGLYNITKESIECEEKIYLENIGKLVSLKQFEGMRSWFEEPKSAWLTALNVVKDALQNSQLITRQVEEEKLIAVRRPQELRDQLQVIQQSLNDCQNNVWNIRDQIRAQELLLIAEQQKLKNSQDFHSAQIKTHEENLNRIILELKKELDCLLQEQSKSNQEISVSSLELEVNQDFFSKIHMIIQTMDFKNQLIDRFMSLYSSQKTDQGGLWLLL